MTFIAGFTLVIIGSIVGFTVAAVAASASRTSERAAHARALKAAVKRGNKLEQQYLALLEAHLNRERHERTN